MARSLVLACLAVVPSCCRGELVFVGSGGCDGADRSCVPSPAEEEVLHAIHVQPDGKLVPGSEYPVDGLPVWLTPFHTGEQQCLFVLRADKDDILSLVVDGVGVQERGSYATGGAAPVFADVARVGPNGEVNVLLVANYHGPDDATSSEGASAVSMHIHSDCTLELADVHNHSGSSVDKARQSSAHVHSFVFAPFGDFRTMAYACDLGLDQIFAYEVLPDGGLAESVRVNVTPGSGPRHLAQHPSKDVLYVLSEMGMSVMTFGQVSHAGSPFLSRLQTHSLVPDNVSGKGSKAAEILVHPRGNAVYATNRGVLNTVTVFSVIEDGMLSPVQQIQVPAYPRGMAFALGGDVLLVAGQSRSAVAAYRIREDGQLGPLEAVLTEGVPPHPAAFATVSLPSLSSHPALSSVSV